MTANMKCLVYILILRCFAVSAAPTNGDKALDNLFERKIIKIIDLQGILGDLELNATYKNINTLNIASKTNESVFEVLEQPDLNVNNEMQSQKALLDKHTAFIEQLKAQIAILEATVLNLKNLLSTNYKYLDENEATSCLDFDSWESVNLINVPGIAPFRVLCDACGSEFGWIVIQRRFDGSLGFYRDWNSYRFGFGFYDSEFFLGLEYIHRLTISRPYELYIELVDFENKLYEARYDNFLIGSEQEKYMLKSLGTYSGNAGDALSYNLYDKFSTYDSDNDKWFSGNCANYFESGWWFNSNANSNLNGNYLKSGESNKKGIWWYPLRRYGSLKSVKMLIRPKYTLL
ncbi:ficolin-1-like [Drosophila innubila]|uniref:ficolin-1-like n=1 Tax=Drosophila innubila TaxID=198719 RepID=UPI00148C9FA0|nr:ficolin-1-like [Drosophila innubila]